MHHPPQLTYNGLTIIMSNPSRFDNKRLLDANGGHYFSSECLGSKTNRFQCDIRLTSNKQPLLTGTKCVLLLGEKALQEHMPEHIVKGNTLHELRGYAYDVNGVAHVASYLPQDAMDPQNYEQRLNEHLQVGQQDDVVAKTEEGAADKKRHAKTDRKNYKFWLKKDTQKALRLVYELDGRIPQEQESHYVIYPSADTIVDRLSRSSGSHLFFDMETNGFDRRITCFAFAFDLETVYVVPIVRHDYTLAYNPIDTARIFRALALAAKRNTLVAHNGAGFDFPILAIDYHIPIGRLVYDTMVAQHRIFPDIEKSLGHCVSLWTWEPYHKDEANFAFGSQQQWFRNLQYCGKDVSTMVRVLRAQLAYADTVPGMLASIEQANRSIRPYLITSLQGMRYNPKAIAELLTENDRLCTHYLRAIKLLIGPACAARIKPKSKTAVECMPTSNAQCTNYFHGELGYRIVGYGKKKKDGTKGPSLAEKHMLKLRLQYNNPVIDLCLAYRQVAKESTSLQFQPLFWRK